MLAKQYRLTKKKDFDLVFSRGGGARCGFLAGKFLKNNLTQSRFGFVVSKKVSSKATVRNTIKRRLRKAVGDIMGNTILPTDVVFVALPGIEQWGFLEIRDGVVIILNKI